MGWGGVVGRMGELKTLIAGIQAMEDSKQYEARNLLVKAAVAVARAKGLGAGYQIDPTEPEWPVAYIKLPTGKVSWRGVFGGGRGTRTLTDEDIDAIVDALVNKLGEQQRIPAPCHDCGVLLYETAWWCDKCMLKYADPELLKPLPKHYVTPS